MNIEESIKKIKDLVAKNYLNDAITELRLLMEKHRNYNDIIIQSARYHELQSQIQNGVTDRDVTNIERNKITKALLDICDLLVDNDLSVTTDLESSTDNNSKQIIQNQGANIKNQMIISKIDTFNFNG